MSSEAKVIENTRGLPATSRSITEDLVSLGVRPGSMLLIHSSLSALGWVCGGAPAVICALLNALGPTGTLVMPTHSTQLTDPASWTSPPVPDSWWETIREASLPYDPAITPTRGMGAIAEAFRSWPGVVRSAHPLSWTKSSRDSFRAFNEELRAWRTVSAGATLRFGSKHSSSWGWIRQEHLAPPF
jgi:aminoglycoside 3-N-acetyltransferase